MLDTEQICLGSDSPYALAQDLVFFRPLFEDLEIAFPDVDGFDAVAFGAIGEERSESPLPCSPVVQRT